MNGFGAVFRKEFTQMLRDRAMLVFAIGLPVFQLVLFGLIDTNVKHVPTVVFDQSRTSSSRELLRDFVNTSYFDIVDEVASRNQLRAEIVAGRASIGIEIPPDYDRQLVGRETADVQVLIDGSDSAIASQTLAAANGVVLQQSLKDAITGGQRPLKVTLIRRCSSTRIRAARTSSSPGWWPFC